MPTRLITSRYPGKCRKCRTRYAAGTPVYWTKGLSGAVHQVCPDGSGNEDIPIGEPPAPKTRRDSNAIEFSVDFAEVCGVWNDAANGLEKKHFKSEANRKVIRGLAKRWNKGEDWMGGSSADMRDWLARGYPMPELEGLGSPAVDPAKERRRIRYSEEGEFQYDLMRSGFDYPFLEWTKRESIPGMKVDVGYTFLAWTDVKVIGNYARWIGRAIHTLETGGVDCEIAVLNETSGTFLHDRRGLRVRIVVKRENQALDIAGWSPMFSPAGFRMLAFTAIVLAGERNGLDVNSGLGQPSNAQGWNVALDKEERTLHIEHPSAPRDFPESEMTDKLRVALEGSKH